MSKDNNKTMKTWLFSVVGVLCMGVLLLAVNMIMDPLSIRVDCTEENLYTLSDGTVAILKEAKDEELPIEIRFYFSKDLPSLPVYLKGYASRVQDLLKEYEQKSSGFIEVVKKNPKPYSDDEDSAGIDGISGQPMGAFGTGDKVYLGLAISCLEESETIPFLSPDRENMLEYDVTRAIYRVMNPKKRRLGVLSSLPAMGSGPPMNPMMQMQQPNRKPPWVVINELKRDYDVVEIDKSAEQIDADIDVLILIHPKGLEDKTLFAIDQYLLGGGKLLGFLDAMSVVEQQNQQNPQMRFMPPGASELGKLLDAWGVEISSKVLADREYKFERRRNDGGSDSMPTALVLPKAAIDGDDPAIGELENLLMFNAGVFTGSGADGLQKTALLQSSEDSQLVETYMAQGAGERILQDFTPDEKRQDLAIRLTGTFKTAFPDGKPDADAAGDDKEKDGKAAAADNALKEGGSGAVILVGDSDMIYDNFCVQVQNFFGQQIVRAMNDNLSFALNLVEQLSGDTRLISIRSRGAVTRPLEVVHQRRAEAEKRNIGRVKAFEDERAELEKKLNEMLSKKAESGGGRVVISQEQLKAIEKLREKKVETNRKLKEEQKKMTREIEALENWVMAVNIAGMPVLVAICGLALAFIQRRRMVRK